jgi:glycerophosphoryl diester phosphodiesterase
MLLIGHRGSKGTHPENTVAALREAMHADADMVEFDLRITKDGVPVLVHDVRLQGSRRRELAFIRRYTLSELRKRTAGSEMPMTTFDEAMKECFGKIFINIEVKELSVVRPMLEILHSYASTKSQWDSMLISSFKPLILREVRKELPDVALGLVHYRNPLTFIAWHRSLSLSAVGWHRLHISVMAVTLAKKFGLFTYAYTVNRVEAVRKLEDLGIDGVVTDYPRLFHKKLDRKS